MRAEKSSPGNGGMTWHDVVMRMLDQRLACRMLNASPFLKKVALKDL